MSDETHEASAAFSRGIQFLSDGLSATVKNPAYEWQIRFQPRWRVLQSNGERRKCGHHFRIAGFTVSADIMNASSSVLLWSGVLNLEKSSIVTQ